MQKIQPNKRATAASTEVTIRFLTVYHRFSMWQHTQIPRLCAQYSIRHRRGGTLMRHFVSP